MRLYLIYILLLLPVLCHAQSKELMQRIARHETLQKLSYEKKYDSIIIVAGKLPFRDSMYLYSTEVFMVDALLMKSDTTKAMKYLAKAIENQSIKSVANMKYQYDEYKLENNNDYKNILKNFDRLYSKYNYMLHLPMIQDCMEIFYTDTRSRWMYEDIARDTNNQKIAVRAMWFSDSINVDNMKNILRKYGRFPGVTDVGAAFLSDFRHILGHFANHLDADTLYNYLKAATLRGEIPNWYGPFLIDKRAGYYDNGLQIFGEFGNYDNYKGDVYYYSDIKDIDYVDKRRAEFLLPPLYKMAETRKCVLPKGYDPVKQKS